ncbi:Crp/Fnr family transcriptional regulator [Microvirga sp. M2]|uniref:Crp/Fnr family transcriptional regulator n=1 Tax=Microvirga sp. M2 TaxID=3073270 RepID=UPI0039C14B15
MSTAGDRIDELDRHFEEALHHVDLGPVKIDGRLVDLAVHQLIYVEGDAADFFFQVEAGCACTFRCDHYGRRGIQAFHLRNDVFGLEAGVRHQWSAEALSPCRLVRCDRRRLVGLMDSEPAAAAGLWTWLLSRQEEASLRLTSLAHADGAVRLMSFLIDLAARCGRDSGIELQMSRDDIADYLGLSSETVSRIFTRLRREGVITVEGRHVAWPGNRPPSETVRGDFELHPDFHSAAVTVRTPRASAANPDRSAAD